jgi:hypothetical protein
MGINGGTNKFTETRYKINQCGVVNKISRVKHSRISIVRSEGDRGCLELPKSSDYTDYDNLLYNKTNQTH